ncbi:LLM class F420-dependent oxidoreductase [Kribbella sp. CA-253562]|uniref:LLM class F420-dependent oxidoreductase n=1 Tax=Kribbella sp. CA-253562 TaxID=3239942 RepID=UPI003D8E923E
MLDISLPAWGIWRPRTTAEQAAEIEAIGFGALWIPGQTAEIAGADELLAATSSLIVGSSVVNVWAGDATTAGRSYHRLNERFPDRFVLGIGIGHPELNQGFQSPLQAMTRYLDELDAAGVPVERRVIATLGPKMLTLAAKRAGGVIPYSVTPDWTRRARAAAGDDVVIAPEHKVVLNTDPARARETNSEYMASMLRLRNYRTSLLRQGFTDDDLVGRGSDRLVDALVAHGNVSTVAAKLREHVAAGADHVAIQVMCDTAPTMSDTPVPISEDETFDVYRALHDALVNDQR